MMNRMQYSEPGALATGENLGRRGGFTLIELLVVIAIISILMALTAAGTFQVIDGQRESNTRLTLNSVNKTLQAHYLAVIAQANKDYTGGTGVAATVKEAALALAGNDPADKEKRARVIFTKIYLLREFPVRYNQAKNDLVVGGKTIPRKRVYADPLATANPMPTDPLDEARQSSTCLLLALQQNRAGAATPDSTNLAGAIVDTNGDRLAEIVDGWGTPIYFSLFPTGDAGTDSTNPAKSGIGARLGDVVDPNGLLLTPRWFGPSRAPFENVFHPISPDGGKRSFFLIPSLASAGKNRRMGLGGAFMATQNADEASDNLLSHQLKLGQ